MTAIAPINQKPSGPSLPLYWFKFGIVAVFLVSLALRFWGLSRFNTLVFDEVYYARFAAHFLKGELIFTGHPPLSTYLIAIGIWLGNHMPWGNEGLRNTMSGLLLSPWSYRWLNALTGSFIPLVVAAIAYQLSQRRSYALIAAVFAAADGLFLVESRYALNNIYLILFGLLGNLFLLICLKYHSWRRWGYLSLAGVFFGASASIKWNGLGFLFSAFLLWSIAALLYRLPTWRDRFFPHAKHGTKEKSRVPSPESRENSQDIARFPTQQKQPSTRSIPTRPTPTHPTPEISDRTQHTAQQKQATARNPHPFPLFNLPQLHPIQLFLCLICIPAIVYYLSWLPYMQVDGVNSFWQLQYLTWDYHRRVGGVEAHPYCSRWFTWPLMIRPIAYFYQVVPANQSMPTLGLPRSSATSETVYDVHAMGNPFLYWFSTAAIVILMGVFSYALWRQLQADRLSQVGQLSTDKSTDKSTDHAIAAHSSSRDRISSTLSPTHSSLDAPQTLARSMGLEPGLRLRVRGWIALYLLINWLANLLPWVTVRRCVFLYHYMASSVFALLAIALLVDYEWRSGRRSRQISAWVVVAIVLLSFVFWLPFYLGLPLSPFELLIRRWLPTWV